MKKKKNKIKVFDNNRNANNECLKLSDKQINYILNEIKNIHEKQSEQLNKTINEINDFNLGQNKIKDTFSKIVRWVMFCLFIGVGFVLALGTIVNVPTLWKNEFYNDLAVIILLVLGIVLIVLGFSIIKIDDRNYLISVFSALVALAALIVAIIK